MLSVLECVGSMFHHNGDTSPPKTALPKLSLVELIPNKLENAPCSGEFLKFANDARRFCGLCFAPGRLLPTFPMDGSDLNWRAGPGGPIETFEHSVLVLATTLGGISVGLVPRLKRLKKKKKKRSVVCYWRAPEI